MTPPLVFEFLSLHECCFPFFFRGKYINIILKMEEMLKSWFPNVNLQDQLDVTQTEEAVPSKKLKVKLQQQKKAALLCNNPPPLPPTPQSDRARRQGHMAVTQ